MVEKRLKWLTGRPLSGLCGRRNATGTGFLSGHILLTGGTGLLGRYLIRDLLARGHDVAALVRGTRTETAQERLDGVLRMWEAELGAALPVPKLLEGDVTEEGLGLDRGRRRWIADNCSSLMHSAAVLVFEPTTDGEPRRTNVGGTRAILALAREAGIPDFHYISTAYVCGRRPGRIMESEIDCGQAFRNVYEESKFEAETMVRAADYFRTLTVYRPAVIAGDSRTGYTSTYHGLYLYLKLISVLATNVAEGPTGQRDTPLELDMTGDEQRNVIPVDWTSAVIAHLFDDPTARDMTFHLAPEQPLTPRQILAAATKRFGVGGVVFSGRPEGVAAAADALAVDWRENVVPYKEYELTDPTFDTTNLRRHAPELPCPVVDEAMLDRFWAFAEADRWGKRQSRRARPAGKVAAE
jgi:thioester reductase-like protein